MAKKLSIILVTIVTIIIIFTSASYAISDTPGINLGLKGMSSSRKSGTYTYNNKNVIKIVKYDKDKATEIDDGTSIYCLKGGVGFGTEAYETNVINYTQRFPLGPVNNIEAPYGAQLPTDPAIYNKLMWVLDHIYIPAKTGDNVSEQEIQLANESRQRLLDNAGVASNSFLRTKNDETEDIIESIQQVAIWYYTNLGIDDYSNPSTDTLELMVDGESIIDKYGLDIFDNEIDQIYSYLVNSADATYESQEEASGAISFTKNNAVVVPDATGANYIIGPYKIEETPHIEYTLNAQVTSGNTPINGVKVLNSERNEITTGTTITDKIKTTIGNNFYILVPANSNVSRVTLNIEAKYDHKTKIYWSVGEGNLAINQPVVIISNSGEPQRESHTVEITNPEFDLALRKFITKINNNTISNRIPEITQDYLKKLATGTAEFDNGTTTLKPHIKTPLIVNKDEKITYTIRIYNEGDVDGYATTIADYLPDGLELVSQEESSTNRKYNWQTTTEGGKTKVYTNYLQNTAIPKFVKNPTNGVYSLNYKDVEIECRVTKSPSAQNISLKNIAEIESARDINGNETDRDSIKNNLTEAQKNNYLPGTSEEGKGYEDDDDYEELTILGRYFDLSLRKFITQVDDKPITTREPQVNVEPLIDGKGKTTAEYVGKKTPVRVVAGSIVTYTIRVYNEGQVDGYANEIVDHLPPELEFIVEDDINAEYGWLLDPTDKTERTVRTTILSEEKDKDNIIPAFNANTKEIKYKDIKIRCRVKTTAPTLTAITNIAEITKYSNESNLTDRDNPKYVQLPQDKDLPNYKQDEIDADTQYIPGQEDDDDFEKVMLEKFDLALRKFITGVNNTTVTSRIPEVDTSKYGSLDENNKKITSFEYIHPKTPVKVSPKDTVIYTIRVYNEGTQEGYAKEIRDDIPEGLIFLPDNENNIKYRWTMYDAEGKVTKDVTKATDIRSDYLAKANETTRGENLLEAYDEETMTTPDFRDVKVAFKVSETEKEDRIIINSAQISKNEDKDGKDVEDIDSIPDEWRDIDDDQDIEKIYVQYFDLALRKFITGVNETQITSRIPDVDTSKYGQTDENGKEITSFEYIHSKEPVKVCQNDIVIYTIRVYNEGTQDGYAKEIRDDIPKGLVFLPGNEINAEYRWKMYDSEGNETEDVTKATDIKSDYLAMANERTKGENLIKAYDAETMTTPDYRDVKVAFKVSKAETEDRIIINSAQISKNEDKDGDDVEDIDSTPDSWIDEDDDQDIEKIYVQYFDLALRKWVSHVIVIEDGLEKVKDTGHYAEQDPEPVVKVDLNQKRIDNTVIKFKYQIRVENQGEIPGYAEEISDYIPEGLEFNQADNPLWKMSDGKITTDQLKDALLNPGDTKTVEVVLTWKNDAENMGTVMTNLAEISKDKNDSDTPDKDSTPNNKAEGEDDIDDAPVILTMVTGKAPTYIALISGILVVIAGGIFLIKKYVI